MSNIELITKLVDFKQFTNSDEITGIITRITNKQFESIQKAILEEINQEQGQIPEILKNLFQMISKNNNTNMGNIVQLSNLKNIDELEMILNGLNLCATVAGFAIMYDKLNKMSSQINKVLSTIKQVQETQGHYEFKKILSIHCDMLDHRKTKKYYTEEQMRELVDGEYNVLSMLIEVFEKGNFEDVETLLYSIISLSAMLAVSLKHFDEIYYFNNKDNIQSGEIWHTSHSCWLNIYDELTSEKMVEALQDYAIFNKNFNTQKMDLFCINVLQTIKDAKKEIEDNQSLLIEFENEKKFNEFKNYTNTQIKEKIEKSIQEVDFYDNNEAKQIINNILKQVGIIN